MKLKRLKNFKGYTHQCPEQYLKAWKNTNCKKKWHLWDEVMSDTEHYLYCDACDEVVHIQEKSK